MFNKILYDVKETSAVLSISPQMVRRLVTHGQLRATRVGDRVLLSASELQRYVKAHTR
jgi:excisionase family DNA binding protein